MGGRDDAWCGRCGSTGVVYSESLDQRHPIVRCQRRNAAGTELASCGTLPGTRDQLEAEQLREQLHATRIGRRHDEHMRAGKAHPDCPACRHAPPIARDLAHDYSSPGGRWDTIKHLVYGHDDPWARHQVERRTPAELTEHHQELHGITGRQGR